MYHKILLLITICATLNLPSCTTEPTPTKDQYKTTPDLINRDTQKALALNTQAANAIQENNLTQAKKLLLESLKIDKMIAQTHNNLGKVYYLENSLYKAAWEYQYAIKLSPKAPAPHHNLGITYQAASQIDKALSHYTMAHEKEPKNPTYIASLAQARLILGHKDMKTQILLKQLILHSTDNKQKSWAKKQLSLMSETVNKDKD